MATLVIPETTADDDGWEHYATPIVVSPELTPGQGSPEAAVVHFYAALMRGDRSAAEASLADPERAADKMDELAGWTFESVSVVAKKMRKPTKGYVRLAFRISVDGDTEEGEDDATVRERDGVWTIQRPPT